MTADALEAAAHNIAHNIAFSSAEVATSSAISLKRIADALEALAKPPGLLNANELSSEQKSLLREEIEKGGGFIVTGENPPTIVRKVPIQLSLTEIESVKLGAAPPGLYLFEGELIVKTQYATKVSGMTSHKPDCYIVDGGEYFCGGVHESAIRDLLVTPVSFKLP